MSIPEAAEIVMEEAGDHLDPDCVRALFEILGLQHHLRLLDLDRGDLAA
jgi:HD-GYP domain-containing protein (c-di-GMP phosphodiesterase class II)